MKRKHQHFVSQIIYSSVTYSEETFYSSAYQTQPPGGLHRFPTLRVFVLRERTRLISSSLVILLTQLVLRETVL